MNKFYKIMSIILSILCLVSVFSFNTSASELELLPSLNLFNGSFKPYQSNDIFSGNVSCKIGRVYDDDLSSQDFSVPGYYFRSTSSIASICVFKVPQLKLFPGTVIRFSADLYVPFSTTNFEIGFNNESLPIYSRNFTSADVSEYWFVSNGFSDKTIGHPYNFSGSGLLINNGQIIGRTRRVTINFTHAVSNVYNHTINDFYILIRSSESTRKSIMSKTLPELYIDCPRFTNGYFQNQLTEEREARRSENYALQNSISSDIKELKDSSLPWYQKLWMVLWVFLIVH